MPEERKLVTVLFADIVGSTALGESHDPEVVRATLGRTFTAINEVLVSYGGTVEKFIGDAVMAVFGVPSAHDDDAERAVRAAFALRDRVAQMDRSSGPALELRLGINSGEAVAGSGQGGQFLVTGPVVNAAARIQQAASPGEMLVGALTRRLTRGGIRYGEGRALEVKGIGRLEAWPAQELLTAVPEQHRGLPGLRAPLIGRAHELRMLTEAYAALSRSRTPHLVTIYGPAGSGKSRLTGEFVNAIGHEHVRSGRCLPYGEGITFYPLQLILRGDARIGIAETRDRALQKLRTAAAEAFADLPEEADAVARRLATIAGLSRADEALPEVAPEDLRDELQLAVRRFFERRAETAPLVLLFEDIHWAEAGLLDLVEHLAEWSRAPLLVLCLARLEFRETRPVWGSGAANATAITLAPLTPGDTRHLIAELLAVDDLPEALRMEVVSRAEGNPLYVEEFLRMLMETGRIVQRDMRWIATSEIHSVEVPPTLQGLITARLDRVAAPVKELLQRASLAGRLFSTAALTALAEGIAPDAALLREAVRRDLLVEADEQALGPGRVFRFKHVLIRDVTYSTVPKSERSRLHDRYGRWLEVSLGDRRNEVADIVAHHAEQAYLLARELGAAGASDLGRRALTLLLTAGANAHDRDDPAAALNLYERAAAVTDGVEASPAELADARGYRALLHQQLSRVAPPVEDLEAAVAIARAAGPRRVLVEMLPVLARLSQQRGELERSRELRAEMLSAARATGDDEVLALALWLHGFSAYYEGDLAEGRRRLLAALEHMDRTEIKRFRGPVLFWLGMFARYAGEYTESRRYVDATLAHVTARDTRFARAIVPWVTARHAYDLGDLPTAAAKAEEALALFRELGSPAFIGGVCWHLGETLLQMGEPGRARAVLAEAIEIFERRRQRGQIPEVKARFARACVRLGDLPTAREHAEAARSVAMPTDVESRFIATVALAEVSEAEGDPAAADILFSDALAVVEGTPFRNAVATVREAYAEFLIRQGRHADARRELQLAREFYRDPLASRHRDRIDALLAKTAGVTA